MLPTFISEEVALRKSTTTYRSGGGPHPLGVPDSGGWLLNRLVLCNGEFTFTASDSKNCGNCGVICATNETCCGGHCVSLQQNCGGCGPSFSCDKGQNCCFENGGFACKSQNDPDHCGLCDI